MDELQFPKSIINKSAEAVFPIIGRYNGEMLVKGTGVFITDNGYFIAANHIFQSRIEGERIGYLDIKKDEALFLEIKDVLTDIYKDFYIGKIEIDNNSYLQMEFADLGTGILTCELGFPSATIKVQNDKQSLDISNLILYNQPNYIFQKVTDLEFGGNDYLSVINGYLLKYNTTKGMSGGACIDINGKLIGVVNGAITNAFNYSFEVVTAVNSVKFDIEKAIGMLF